jgi:hypothetical protein
MADILAQGMPLTPMEMQVQQQALDRQRAIATLLQQQSLTPTEGQMVSGHYVKASPLQFISKLAQGLIGKNQQSDLDAKQLALATQQGDMTRGQFGIGNTPQMSAAPSADVPAAVQSGLAQGASAGSVGPTNDNAARVAQVLQNQPPSSTPSQPQPSGNMVIPGMNPIVAMQQFFADQKGYNSDYRKQFEPTELQKTMTAAGIDPRSLQGQQILNSNLAKTNYIAPPNFRPGGFTQDPITKQITNFPKVPDGFQAISDGKGGFSIIPVSGGLDAIASGQAALKQGQNRQTIGSKEMLPTNANGTVIPTSIDALLNGTPQNAAPSASNPSAAQSNSALPADAKGNIDLSKLDQPTQDFLRKQDPAAFDAAIARFNGGAAPPTTSPGVGAPFGAEHAADLKQTVMSDKFKDLTKANSEAATTNSYLQNIKNLSDKAGAGGFSDKVQFTNNLLSYAGISDKATDAVTAKNLLDKFSNQITARLGGGANGSDARSAIIEAAYPNSKMTPAAIREAVDNLVGANQMTQAKLRVLSPHANASDPVSYQQKEQIFDTNADPRIWQYKNIQDPAARKAFAASVMRQDPAFPTKIKALESIGALQ